MGPPGPRRLVGSESKDESSRVVTIRPRTVQLEADPAAAEWAFWAQTSLGLHSQARVLAY